MLSRAWAPEMESSVDLRSRAETGKGLYIMVAVIPHKRGNRGWSRPLRASSTQQVKDGLRPEPQT